MYVDILSQRMDNPPTFFFVSTHLLMIYHPDGQMQVIGRVGPYTKHHIRYHTKLYSTVIPAQ